MEYATAPAAGGEQELSRERSRSPKRAEAALQPGTADGSAAVVGQTSATPVLSSSGTLPGTIDFGQTISAEFQLPSSKLGQLLGFKGLTIQRIKEASGVQRLHIQDKDKAKVQPTVSIQITGLTANVSHCTRMLDALVAGDQTEIGHLTTYLNVDPQLIGKLMGYKGQTVKEMTEVTGCYIEIQQYQEQGVLDGQPRLFFAGTPDKVDAAVNLAERFIASPGSRLDAVLPPGTLLPSPGPKREPLFGVPGQQPQQQEQGTPSLGAVAQALLNAIGGGVGKSPPLASVVPTQTLPMTSAVVPAASPPVTLGGTSAVATEPGGPLEERVVELPARFKGHLLGLKGTTIETIRQISGVIKCHMNEKRTTDRTGTITVQIVGTHDCVEACAQLINGIMIGDHTGIGHVTTYVMVDPSVVGKIMGHKGQTIKEMTERTGCYIEIQQYPEQGVFDGQPKLFIAGPPEKVETTVNLVERFVTAPGSRLETVLSPGELPLPSPQAAPVPQGAGGPQLAQQLSALAALAGAPAPSPAPVALVQPSSPPQMSAGGSSVGAALATLVAALGGGGPGIVGSGNSPHAAGGWNAIEERIIEVPASKKGHLLGLRGQTIETVRQKSGVKKCHMMDKNTGTHTGSLSVQIVGTHECVETCIAMVTGIVNGDHSSIGHATDIVPLELHKVNGLMGHRGQTVTILKDLTGAYLDIQQGPQAGVPAGSAQVFIAGPPDKVQQAKTVVTAFLAMMDHLPPPGDGATAPGGAGIGSAASADSMGQLLQLAASGIGGYGAELSGGLPRML